MLERHGRALAPIEDLRSRLPNGCRVPCDLRDHVERQIYFWGAYECIETWLYWDLLQVGNCVVDAGANVGQYSVIASTKVGGTGQVHAFEPVPVNCRRLTRNLSENRIANVRANQCALWDSVGMCQLSLPPHAIGNNNGSFSIGATSVGTRVRVPCVRFDDYATKQGIRRVDLVKMDVEGAELKALSGMAETIVRDRPALLLEVNPEALAAIGASPDELEGLLRDEFNYQIWHYRSDRFEPLCTVFRQLSQQNVICFYGDPPPALRKPRRLKAALRWARTGR